MPTTDTINRDDIAVGPELAKKLFKSAYFHRGIISSLRVEQFSKLVGHDDTPLETVLTEIARFPERRIEGTLNVNYDNQLVRAYSVIWAVVNMIMVYCIKSFHFLRAGIERDKKEYGTYNLDRVFDVGEQVRLRHRIQRSLALLEPLMYCDLRWNFIVHGHLFELRDKVQDLIKCLDRSDRYDYVVKFQTFIEPWIGHKPRPRQTNQRDTREHRKKPNPANPMD